MHSFLRQNSDISAFEASCPDELLVTLQQSRFGFDYTIQAYANFAMANLAIVSPAPKEIADGGAAESRLLRLPAELRNEIYRYTVIDDSAIIIDVHGFREPHLFMACKEVRKEAAPIFYAENKFQIDIEDYGIAILHSFHNIILPAVHRGEAHISVFRRFAIASTSTTPNWSNVLELLREYHSARISTRYMRPSNMPEDEPLDTSILGGMFAMIDRMKENPWPEVEEVVMEFRVILAKIDARWNL